ncbi:MAG: thiamine diphosphokinase [Clostridia bacterium]|jgi:thiamine pyrophosphokinase|nr:thiamine diphosphokinase [Clostridia bacterium]
MKGVSEAKCIIISGGLWEDDEYHRQVLQEAEMIICADSGAGYALRLGIIPNIVIGDLDSLAKNELAELQKQGVVEFIQYPQEKDYTDTHLALQKALELGYQRIEMLACLGGRFDHALSNVMLLTIPQVRDLDIRILEPTQELFLVKPKMKIAGKKGDVISLLPLSPEVTGITSTGLYYQVPQGMLTMGVSLGVSNVFTEDVIELSFEKGLLLAIHIKKEKSDNFRFLFFD